MGARHHLKILIWKHLKERRHRLRHTIWEITSGVLVFVVLLLMKKVVKELTVSKYDHVHGLEAVVYTPNTAYTQYFMKKVANKFRRDTRGTDEFEDDDSEVRINNFRGFDSETDIEDYLQQANFSVAKIVFKNFSPTLDYSIGIENAHPQYENKEPKLKTIQLLGEPAVPQEIVLPALASLQWEIDKTFMESLTGHNISHALRTPPGDLSGTPINIMHQFLVLCTVAAPLPFFLYNSSRLVDEKRSGMKELMKIENVSPNILRLSHLVDTAIMATIYATLITIMLKITSNPILPHSCGPIIAVTIILYFMNVTSLAFVTSTLSDDYEHANSLALVIYIATCVVSHIWHSHAKNTSKAFTAGWFLPHAAIYMFWEEVHYLEKIGQGIRFGNLFHQHESNCIPVPLAWTILVVQFLFIMMLTWYLDLVIPGVYGVTLPWYFLFQRQFWSRKRKVNFHVTSEWTKRLLRDDRYYEHVSVNVPIIIKLSNVTKVFPLGKSYFKALENVRFDAYRGEITVVLGTNGAGKTTIASIIAGMTSATTGKVYVNGYDNSTRIRDVRQFIGLCPQQHLTFDYLTVRENITFFEQLGQTQVADSGVESLMAKLHLLDKADFFSHQLSSGGERCLQMACTLAGGADVLILDEPTANCDATTRHYLWDAILVLRGSKTILLTTTSIEEADALGDRIALLNHGRLRCYGTPTFLKRALDTGFNLTITTTDEQKLHLIREAVLLELPDATSKIQAGRVIFSLPAKDHELFTQLFTSLEGREEELGIAAMDMGMSMEEMFLGFVVDTADDDEALFVKMFHDVEKLKGWRLVTQQLRTLMIRYFRRLWSNKYQFVILQLAVPVLGLIVVTIASNRYADREGHAANTLLLGLDGGFVRSDDMDYVKREFPGLKILRSQNITIDYARVPHKQYQHVMGIHINKAQSDLYHPMHSQQDLTKAVNVFSNIFMALNQYPRRRDIRTDYVTRAQDLELVKPKEPIILFLWAMWVTFIITLPLTPYIGMLTRELGTGIRMTYFVVGCSYKMQWLTKLMFHSTVFLLVMPLALLLSAKFGDLESTLDQNEFLFALLLVQLCFLPAFLLQLYVLSFFLNTRHATSQIYIMSIGMGFSGPFIHLLLETLVSQNSGLSGLILGISFLGSISPVFTLSETITKLVQVATYKAFCRLNEHQCNKITPDDKKYKALYDLCCGPDKGGNGYFDMRIAIPTFGGFLWEVILYSIILILLQNRYLQSICERIFNRKYQAPIISDHDQNVNLERLHVDQLVSGHIPEGILLVKGLHKKYLNIRKENRVNAVKGVTFKVERGECLAILGRNGAGKTSTLCMISGRIPITRGECCADGLCLRKSRSKYVEKIAKIKDTGSLDEFYTASENVAVLCLLRGYRRGHAEMFAVNWMAYMGLQRHTNALYGAVSPGCARRIGLCAALLADRFAVLVDEPMRFVDPHARPLVKRALTKLRSKGCALLVAEKSLDWMELDSLASRIAVLSKGQIIALGSSDHIRNLLANGHTARLKLKLKPIGLSKEESSVIYSTNDVDSVVKDDKQEITGTVQSEAGTSRDVFEAETDDTRSLVEKKQASTSRDVTNSGTDDKQTQSKSKYNLVEAKRLHEEQEAEERESDSNRVETEGGSVVQHEIETEKEFGEKKDLTSTSVISLNRVQDLKSDFKRQFPTSELAEEHLSVLYFHIRSDDSIQYSEMFSRLESLKKEYQDIVEDFSLSQISLEDMYGRLAIET